MPKCYRNFARVSHSFSETVKISSRITKIISCRFIERCTENHAEKTSFRLIPPPLTRYQHHPIPHHKYRSDNNCTLEDLGVHGTLVEPARQLEVQPNNVLVGVQPFLVLLVASLTVLVLEGLVRVELDQSFDDLGDRIRSLI